MAVLQSTYATSIPIGYAGMVAVGEKNDNIISRTLESSAGIAYGQPAYQGSGDHGVVIGGTFAATGTATAAAGNTGNGAMGAVTVTAGAKQGRYAVEIVEPAANAGAFVVTDPDGQVSGHGNVASAYSANGVAFTLADGATDFLSGDTIYIDVAYTANTLFRGIVVKDDTLPPNAANPDLIPQYWTVALMTAGVIWVTAGATVAAGDDVYWNPATSRFTKTTTHIRIPRATFDSSAVNGGLVKVRLR
jgi:hypothetical protein